MNVDNPVNFAQTRMSARPSRWILASMAKGTAILSQVCNLLLLLEIMGAEAFGRYSAALSAGIIIAMLVDFGYLRYSYRLINRNVSVRTIATRFIEIRLTAAFMLFAALLFCYVMLDIPVHLVLLSFIGSTFIQALSINRYVFMHGDNAAAAVCVDASGPIVNLLLLLAFYALSGTEDYYLSPGIALSFFCASGAIVFVLWSMRQNILRVFVRSALYADPINVFWPRRSVLRSVKRSLSVGIEQAVNSTWYNLPVLLASSIAPASGPVAALFQRIINLVISFLSVLVSLRLKSFYGHRGGVLSELKVCGLGTFLAFVITMGLIHAATSLMPSVVPSFLTKSEFLKTASHFSNFPFLVSIEVGLLVGYVRTSFFALGTGLGGVRAIASVAGVAILGLFVSVPVLLNVNIQKDFLPYLISGMSAGKLVGLIILWVSLVRKFGWRSAPKRFREKRRNVF